MAYLDYPGLAYFKSLLDENYLRTNYEGDTVINGNVTFTKPVDASVKNDWLGQQIDKTYLKDVVPDPEGSGALALILGDGTVSHLVTDTTVTQVRSSANELYPILLCYDASAEEDQIAKKVWYGNGVRINPRYGYLYSQKMLTLHPTYNRAAAPTSRVEWTNDFRDSVLNPVGQIFEYIDPVSQGGEHRMELRLYGNPNVAGINTPNVNYETNTVSLGVSATRGDALTFFGYAPSTPIYLEDGSTMRKSLVRGDQYGKDIITRDWLNLNGSITGLVHTYMDETIDGYKTFLKTVTIDSGDDNNKAGLNVQGDVNIDSGDNTKPSNLYVQGNSHTHGNETIDGKLTVSGAAEISGGSGNTPSLKINGDEVVTGKLTAEDLEATDDLTVGDDATISGDLNVPNGTTTTRILHVTDDATVDDNLNVGGTINKVSGGSTTEYVQYITNQPSNREAIASNLIDTSKGLKLYNGKIGVNPTTNGGLKMDSSGAMYVDFASATDETKAAVLSSLGIQVPLTGNKTFYVNKGHSSATTAWRNSAGVIDSTVGTSSKPFKTIQSAINCATQGYSVGGYHIDIVVTKSSDNGYNESIDLPEFQHTSGYIKITSANTSSASNYAVITNKATTVPTSEPARPIASLIDCTGTGWRIEQIKVDLVTTDPGDTVDHFPHCIACSGGGSLDVYGCVFSGVYSGSAPANDSCDIYMRLFSCTTGGNLMFHAMTDVQTTIAATKGNANSLSVFFCERQGQVNFYGSNSGSASSAWHNINCTGTCTKFAEIQVGSNFSVVGGVTYRLGFTGSITGTACEVSTLSMLTSASDPPSSLTGGTADSTSYASSGWKA